MAHVIRPHRRRTSTPTSTPHEHKSLLRFITCGSVDDGKSTLIGRLLYDSQAAVRGPARGARGATRSKRRHAGRRARLRAAGRRPGGRARAGHHHRRRLPLLLHRRGASSSSPTRPGHEQYTRNMVTGASTADLAVILIDARKGVLTQTRRHSYLVSLLGIRHVVLAVNKMDLVDYRAGRLRRDRGRLPRVRRAASASTTITLHPALGAATATTSSRAAPHMPWYRGPTLSSTSRRCEVDDDAQRRGRSACRCSGSTGPNLDFRGFAGTIAARHASRPGDAVARAAVGHETARSRASSPATATSTRPSPARRSRSRSPTRSTSAAATCSAPPTTPAGGRRPVRGAPSSGWTTSRCCRGRRYLLKIGTQHGQRDDRAAQVQGQRQHARARWRRRRSSSTRSASATLDARPADRLRPLRREPRHWAASS